MSSLWPESSLSMWRKAQDSYRAVIAAQVVTRLAELDAWYRY
jgi:hypothetical protein